MDAKSRGDMTCMNMSGDDFERSGQADPLVLFGQGIRAEKTREKYTRTLQQVLCGMLEDLKATFEGRASQLVRMGREDPGWIRDLMLGLSRKIGARTHLQPDHSQYLPRTAISLQQSSHILDGS